MSEKRSKFLWLSLPRDGLFKEEVAVISSKNLRGLQGDEKSVRFHLKGIKEEIGSGLGIRHKPFTVNVSLDEFARVVQNPEPGLHEARDGKIVKREPVGP